MNKYKYVTLMAAALITGLSSCSSDEVPADPNPEAGEETKMSLSIVQPKTYATDNYATEAEVTINTVDVYIYNGSTFLKRVRLNKDAFNETPTSSNTWELKSNYAITTTAGDRTIYVGVNLPIGIAEKIERTDPATVAQTITEAEDLHKTLGFAMFSTTAKTSTLVVAKNVSNLPASNVIKATVSRLLAKVIVEKGSQLTDSPIQLSGGTIQDLEFTISNVNTKFFPLPATSKPFIDPNWTSLWSDLSDFKKGKIFKNVSSNGVAWKEETNTLYTTENTSQGDNGVFREGDHTYVAVRGTYVPAAFVTLDAEDKIIEDGSLYVTGDDFFLITVNGKRYFFKDATAAAKYYSLMNIPGVNTVKQETYTNGLCYYAVFLNPNPIVEENPYDVLRNTIYKVTITRINGLGTPTDIIGECTEPGEPGDPENPINEPTYMSVTVDILNWAYTSQEAELDGK